MGYEIDFLPVGSGEKSGDAIAIRWGCLGAEGADQRVIVIDGGTKEAGYALVHHIQDYYRTNEVDCVICTHCDADHASGLSVVVEKLSVGALLMHEPWQHAKEIRKLFVDESVPVRKLMRRIEDGLEAAYDLWELAVSKSIPIVEPFSAPVLSAPVLPTLPEVTVLGPDREWYEHLVSNFRCVPQTQPPFAVPPAAPFQQVSAAPDPSQSIAAYERSNTWFPFAPIGNASGPQTAQTLDRSGTTSEENNSSAIVLLAICGHKMLFTGDAGTEALCRAISHGHALAIDFSDLELFHVPHHGSENNLDPHVLDKLGSRVAVVSAAPDGAPKHPASKVTNALIGRGTAVYATRGQAFCYSLNAPPRPGWSSATPVPYDYSLSAGQALAGTGVLPPSTVGSG